MSENLLIATPMSRAAIREITSSIRRRFGIMKLKFPLIEFVEFILPLFIDRDFHLEIRTKNEMPHCYAQAIPEEHKIILREDVYYNIYRSEPRSILTLAHELGHYILHTRENIVVLNRYDGFIPPYQDPEWQANTFARELLVPYGKVLNFTSGQVAFYCGVSNQVAEIQLKENKKGS